MSNTQQRTYVAIDLKSFYASCECMDRGLDPLTAHLVVADEARTSKTIVLAVSPALKEYGIPGRPRLFEVEQRVAQVNRERIRNAPGNRFAGEYRDSAGREDPSLALGYIVAPPRMSRYMDISTRIYSIYLGFVAPEDIFAYSIDEVFIDVTAYLSTYQMTPHELTIRMIRAVLKETGITATAGIGTNLFLAKVAMDVVAKHMPADEDGVRIAELDERSYREKLWSHEPITDIWRVGRGTADRLAPYDIRTMGDIARVSVSDDPYRGEELLYRLFGVGAELLIDHAWGYEPTTLSDVRSYIPETRSVSSGQVLQHPYDFNGAKLITREMTDLLVLDLVDKELVCDAVVLTIGYDVENLTDPDRRARYHGPVTIDRYGRKVPKHAHGTANLGGFTSSTRKIIDAMMELYDRVVNPDLLVRRVTVVAENTVREDQAAAKSDEPVCEQLDLFTDYTAREQEREAARAADEKEKSLQHAVLNIQKRYGKNAILKGMNLQEGAMTIERNAQVGGHKA
ncbi:MAG: DNA methylase [Lachnospiraceae bacterium]|nr:DNA methylase [Lachnospiraceae bacterium]